MSWNPGSAMDGSSLSLSSLLSVGTVTPASPDDGSGDLNQMISISAHPTGLTKRSAKEATVIITVFIRVILWLYYFRKKFLSHKNIYFLKYVKN